MYQTIVVPTDGSDISAKSAEHAIELAEQFDAEIHALYVLESTPAFTKVGLSGLADELDEDRRNFATQALETVTHLADAHGVAAVSEIVRGRPSEKIVEYAEDVNAELIVMAAHGGTRGSRVRWLLGSTTDRVARNGSVPVLIFR